MKENIGKVLKSYHNVQLMLESIPEELWDLFLPDDESDLAMLEADILAQRKRDLERDKVMAIQKLCGFPLRPNEPVHEVTAKARIQGVKNAKLFDNHRRDKPNMG